MNNEASQKLQTAGGVEREARELAPLTDATGRYLRRCQGIKASFGRCKCWAIMYVNAIPYCKQHGEKELRKAQA